LANFPQNAAYSAQKRHAAQKTRKTPAIAGYHETQPVKGKSGAAYTIPSTFYPPPLQKSSAI
jgi:hypothetical protein